MTTRELDGNAGAVQPGTAPASRSPARRLLDALPRGGTLPESALRRRHDALFGLLCLHVPVLLVYGMLRGHGVLYSGEHVGVIALVALVAWLARGNARLASVLVTVGLVTASAVLIDLAGGATEAHFHLFVVLALLSLYEDWLPLLVAIGYVVLHHGVLGAIQPASVYAEAGAQAHPWRGAGIHAGFLLAAAAAGAAAWKLTESSRIAIADAHQRARASDRRHHREHALLGAIVACSDDAIVSKTPGGVVTSWNPGAERLYGYSREQAIGRPLGELVVPEQVRGDDQRIIDLVLAGERVTHYETERKTRDGKILNVSISAAAIRDADGRIVGISSVARDITDRKRRELELLRDVDDYSWARRIRTALDEDGFALYAQPVVDLRTGEVTRAEVLLRMRGGRDPNDVVSPGEFLAVAERFELIGEIDRWVLRNVMPLLQGDRVIEVNISGRSIGDLSLTRLIQDLLREGGADPAKLALEVSETAAVDDIQAVRLFADRLQRLGCELLLDDFGTGYGSFTYLKHMPVQYLKIDMQFIRDLVHSESDRQVVKSIVGIARDFSVETIAEGVENRETLDLLKTMGVDFAQGYYLGHPEPVPTEAAGPLLSSLTATIGEASG